MQMSRIIVAAVVSLALVACEPPRINYAIANDRNVVSYPEIEQTQAQSALDLVRKTRPNFLNSRGVTTFLGTSQDLPTVYVDGMRYGTIATLKDIPASTVAEIRMYRVGQASQFGPGNAGGVLSIRTRRR